MVEDEPNSLNTIRNTPFGWQLAPLTQGYLFLVDDRGRLIPDRALALPTRTNGGISPDGRRITYRIRTGRWSDGVPFDARDVGFTIDALRNPRTAVPDTSAVADITSWSAPRPDTLIVQLKMPSAPFISSFLTLGANDPFTILPRHIAAKYASLDQSSLDTDPVGLGPFKLLRWVRGQRLEFERNPYYWRGPAASPQINVAIVPDAQTRLLMVRTGALDMTEVTGFGVDVAKTVPNTRLVRSTTNVVDYLQFNLHSAALKGVDVRRAIAMALDRKKLAAAVYRGTLVPTDTVQSDPRYQTDRRLPAYNPKRAAEILRGKHITLDFAIAGAWRNSSSAAVQIASQLEAAGLTVHIRSYTEAEFWGPKDRGGVLESAHYDLALTSWSPALDPDRSYLFGCAATPPGGGNSMFFCDHGYDKDEAAGAISYRPGAARTLLSRSRQSARCGAPGLTARLRAPRISHVSTSLRKREAEPHGSRLLERMGAYTPLASMTREAQMRDHIEHIRCAPGSGEGENVSKNMLISKTKGVPGASGEHLRAGLDKQKGRKQCPVDEPRTRERHFGCAGLGESASIFSRSAPQKKTNRRSYGRTRGMRGGRLRKFVHSRITDVVVASVPMIAEHTSRIGALDHCRCEAQSRNRLQQTLSGSTSRRNQRRLRRTASIGETSARRRQGVLRARLPRHRLPQTVGERRRSRQRCGNGHLPVLT